MPSLCPIIAAASMLKNSWRRPVAQTHSVVNFKYNIPPKQRRIQQLVAQFNADEELWFSLESKRRARRKRRPRVSNKIRRQLDLLEFASARRPQDCIGFWQANIDGFHAIRERVDPPDRTSERLAVSRRKEQCGTEERRAVASMFPEFRKRGSGILKEWWCLGKTE